MRRVVLVVALLFAWIGIDRAQSLDDFRPTVILVSFDGWRWDYHLKAPAPNLTRLMARGVHAEGLIPSFPSKTFPNHYTIATGLYPGDHGIVANNMWDDERKRPFAVADRTAVRDATWWGGEPIWNTVARAGQKTAPLFWPGSEAPIQGMLPAYNQPYDEAMPPDARVDWVLERLDLPTAVRPTFLTLYFSDLDDAGHDDGPDSPRVREAITRADGYLGHLMSGLEQRHLQDRVNVIVVSDHGMANISPSRVVVIDDYIALDDVNIADLNPLVELFPKAGKEEAVYRALRSAHPRLHMYRRQDTPSRWHYRDHPHIPPLVGVVDDGWQVLRRRSLEDILNKVLDASHGNHGYDPKFRDMHGLFVAAGPAFKQGVTVPEFENVNIYDAMTMILKVTPAQNDGDPRIARRWLR